KLQGLAAGDRRLRRFDREHEQESFTQPAPSQYGDQLSGDRTRSADAPPDPTFRVRIGTSGSQQRHARGSRTKSARRDPSHGEQRNRTSEWLTRENRRGSVN